MTTVRLLADDLTGALDTGAEFAALAAPLHVVWDAAALPPSAAVDTGTRERTAEDARAIAARLAPALAQAALAYKKVDSLLRGPTLAELAAVFAAGPWTRCVFAPAFPFQGRITQSGRQWAQQGLDWVEAGPDLVGALRTEGAAAHLALPGDPPQPGIAVFDADSDDALDAIVEARHAQADTLWCGTGGLAAALAPRLHGGAALAPATLPRPILGLFGSDQDATFAQLQACAPHWSHWPEDGDVGALATALAAGLALVSIDLPPGLPRDVAATRIGTALHGIARAVPRPGTLLVAGGETLRGLCTALGATSLQLEGRIQPGLPRAILRGGAWDGVTVVSKSGAFGPTIGLLRGPVVASAASTPKGPAHDLPGHAPPPGHYDGRSRPASAPRSSSRPSARLQPRIEGRVVATAGDRQQCRRHGGRARQRLAPDLDDRDPPKGPRTTDLARRLAHAAGGAGGRADPAPACCLPMAGVSPSWPCSRACAWRWPAVWAGSSPRP